MWAYEPSLWLHSKGLNYNDVPLEDAQIQTPGERQHGNASRIILVRISLRG